MGNLKQRSEYISSTTTRNEYYCYDNLNRLIRVASSDPGCASLTEAQQDFKYDAFGNLLYKNAATLAYANSGNAGPHAVTGRTVGTDNYAYSYDVNGNLTQDTKNAIVQRAFVYNLQDKPTRITQGSNQTDFGNGAVTASMQYLYNQKMKKWATSDFLEHYMFGGGKAVDLGNVGLSSDFENAPSVKEATSTFVDGTMQGPVFNSSSQDIADTDVTNVGAVDFTGKPALFSVGNGRLFMSGQCTAGSCNFTFETRDYFIDALDSHDQWKGNQDLPFSSPYPINYKWQEQRSYGQ